ncbi:MAG: ABC transporter permease subunit [Candidatus Brocadiia bacterium]
MRDKISQVWEWFRRRVPEILLGLFLLALVPLVVQIAWSAYKYLVTLGEDPGAAVRALGIHWTTTAAAMLCLLGVGVAVYVILRHWEPIWAVARKLIMEAMNRKVVVVLFLFFIVLMPSLPFVLKTEGSLKSQVQLVLLYSLSLALVLLSLVAIFLTTASICSEVERQHVNVTDTKPLHRWQFLLGKWFGVFILCAASLAVMTGATYGLVRYMVREPDYSTMTEEEKQLAVAERQRIEQEVFTARKAVQAPLPGPDEEIERKTREWLEQQERPMAVHSYRQRLIKEKQQQSQSVTPERPRILWRFSGLDPQEQRTPENRDPLQVRFRPFAFGAPRTVGRFYPLIMVEKEGNAGQEEPRYELHRTSFRVASPPGGWQSNRFHEIAIPGRFVQRDGTLYLAFESMTPGTVAFDVDSPIEVLQKEEGFLPNYYRSLVMIMFHVGLLAALGLMAGSLFSFPVASLVVFCLFVGGMLASWFHSNFVEPNIYAKLTTFTVYLDQAWRLFAGAVVAVMPNFGSFNPLGDLVNGRMVSAGRVAESSAVLLFIKGGIAMGIAFYFYTRRELARLIV